MPCQILGFNICICVCVSMLYDTVSILSIYIFTPFFLSSFCLTPNSRATMFLFLLLHFGHFIIEKKMNHHIRTSILIGCLLVFHCACFMCMDSHHVRNLSRYVFLIPSWSFPLLISRYPFYGKEKITYVSIIYILR